ncbi:MAG TPA: hypothetical protein VMZ90_10580 [Vicinamibacterales bacterium]|nr:hypothetical protein [Vicinamibacterales bacterium]
MTFTLTLAFALISGLSQHPPLADAPTAPAAVAASPAPQSDARPPKWVISVRALAPATSTDPQKSRVVVGVAHAGAYRASLQYQDAQEHGVGFVQASLGVRVLARQTWELALDAEHAQARPVRRAFSGNGWELDFHERHQLSIGTASLTWREPKLFGLITALELGGGRMHVWRLVSARAGADSLSPSPDPILESSAPVGILGLTVERGLVWGFTARAHARAIGAGRSPGGEVPFAHATVDWEVTRQLFHSKKFGRAFAGLTGNHSTSPRAVTYFQNGLGFGFRLAF